MVTYTKSKTGFFGGWKATLTLLLVMLVGAALAQDPGHAHRWNAGDGWRYNTSTGKWDIITANAQNLPLGIVRCASSAETESGLQAFTGAYAPSSFMIGKTGSLPETGGLPCFSQETETRGVQVSLPTSGEEIIWFNFDIRPLAGTYQFQIVTNQNVGWALYYVDPAFAGPTGTTATYPPGYNDPNNLNNLSGNLGGATFANLRYADCGVSGNGWSTITVPSFQKPSNYYLAMWQLDPAVTSFPNSTNLVYKSRYGCGGVTCTLEKDGSDVKNCVVGTNNYTVCATYFGSAGKWAIIDSAAVKASSYTVTTYDQFGAQVSTATSTNLSTNPLYLELGTISWASPQNDIKAVICATYPLGANYYIALQPAGTPAGAPSNYIACTSSGRFMGVGLPSNTITPNPGAATTCINTAITPINHTTTGATGIGTATGLPAGVTASFANNTITVSGTPTVAGTFNYTIPLTGGCGTASASGTITVTANNDAGLPVTRTLCINTALSPVITHNVTGATSIGSATGLPAGVTASFANNTITISGTPTVSGTFNYSIPLIGGCGNISATGQITVTPNNTVTGPGSAAPCVNTAMTPITHTTTGATGIGSATGLPAGVTAAWANNTITISGTPTAVGTFNYTIPLTGGCGNVNATGTITVTATNTVSGPGAQTVCVGTAMTAITHNTTGATGIGSATGLPAGLTAAWANNVITISGTPTATGTFNYTIPLTGGCGNVSATGTITVNPNNTVTGPGSRTVCINTAMTAITHTTTGATGIGSATGLPTGVTAVWANNVITISGTPTVSGIFNYTIPLTGGCGNINATGTITVTANNTVTGPGSGSVCVNQALTPITHTTTGATGIGAASGLPAGVTAAWANNVITISGTPTATGTFNYTIPLTGGCGNVNATGTITVTATNTVTGPGARTVCVGTAMTAITHTTTGATGIGAATGLPAGVTAAWANNTITISGTPTATGTFNYTIPLTGGCGNVNATGTITVNANNTVTGPGSRTVCVGTAMTAITHTTTGATGIGSATGLPAGVTAAWANNTITISGTPTVSGTFNYTIPLTGGCGNVSATGQITVTPNNTVTGPGSAAPCVNTAMIPITHTTTGATGIGTATGLPAGVTAAWANNVITISGTPTAVGTFNYSIPLTGGCGNVSATGTITVTPNNTVTGPGTRTVCVGTAMTAITHTTTGATGIGTATGLPTGVSASFANNTITISGTPTATGTFNYTVPLTGGCGNVNATGTIMVNPNNTVTGPGSRTLCVNTPLTAITHTTTGATGIGTATGLPSGVTASFANNTITISGTPTAVGTFNYTVPLTGGCGNVSATGTITVNACAQTLCTYTQGAYGNEGGKSCTPAGNLSTFETIKYALGNWTGDQLVIGSGARSLTIRQWVNDDINAVMTYLPGGGGSATLQWNGNRYIGATDAIPGSMLKNGRFNNTLLSQTLTLGLNMGITTALGDLELRADRLLVTATPSAGCNPASSAFKCPYNAYTLASSNVIQFLYNNYWNGSAFVADMSGNKKATVAELFQLASYALGSTPGTTSVYGLPFGSIASLADQINNIFDECQVFVGYMSSTEYSTFNAACMDMFMTQAVRGVTPEVPSDLKVTAYPNPYNNSVSFNFTSPVSGKALLEVYDVVGRRLAIVFEGQVDAGMQKAVNYNVPSAQRVPMIYKLSIGGKTSFGKLLPGTTD